MKALDNLLDLIFVPSCVVCHERLSHGYLCAKCRSLYEKRKIFICPTCGKPYNQCLCLSEPLKKAGAVSHVKLFLYDPLTPTMPENQMLYSMKRKNNRALAKGLAEELAEALRPALLEGNTFVTYMPRSKRAVREYGVDQSRILARLVAKALGLRFRALLSHKGNETQKLLSKDARAKNAKESYFLMKEYDFSGENAVLLDDISTSGATLAAGIRLLKQKRAEKVVILTLAVVKNASHSQE